MEVWPPYADTTACALVSRILCADDVGLDIGRLPSLYRDKIDRGLYIINVYNH